MKRAWMVAGTVAVFLPTVFVVWLVVAAHWKKLDAVTQHLPEGVRSLVVQAVLGMSTSNESMKRAVKLDQAAVTEWQQRQKMIRMSATSRSVAYSAAGTSGSRADLEQLYKHQREARVDATALAQKAKKQQEAGHGCEAEELYTRAASEDSSMEIYQYAEGVGRAGLQCGELPAARAGLEAAVLKQENFLKGTEEDQLTSVRRDMLKDREYLVVVYERQHEVGLVAATCKQAHADWKACACVLDKQGDVECREKR